MMRRTLILFLLLIHIVTAKDTITVVTLDAAYPPYLMNSGSSLDSVRPGIIIELLNHVAEELQIVFVYKRYPDLRCESLLKNDQIEFLGPWAFREERLNYAHYPMKNGEIDTSLILASGSFSFYVRKGSNITWNGTELKGIEKPVGVLTNSSTIPILKNKYGLQIYDKAVRNIDQNIDRLLAKRVDAIVLLDEPAKEIIERDSIYLQEVIKLEPELLSMPFYFVAGESFFNENRELVQKIWQTLPSIRERYLARLIISYTNQHEVP